jgi:hypothetical protein
MLTNLPTNVYVLLVEQHALKDVNNCLNTKIYSYLETANVYLNFVHFFNNSVRHLWQLKTVVLLHLCLMSTVLLNGF